MEEYHRGFGKILRYIRSFTGGSKFFLDLADNSPVWPNARFVRRNSPRAG